MRKKVIGIGAGGHARVLIEILSMRDDFEIVGLVDKDAGSSGREIDGVPIVGRDDDLAVFMEQGRADSVFMGVGALGDASLRKRLHDKAVEAGYDIIDVIHPTAVISGTVQSGRGLVVGAGAVINAGAVLGENVLVNTGAIVEHDCAIGSHSHIATGAVLTGGVRIGECVLVGAGSTVLQYRSVADGAVTGAGALVLEDVPAGCTVAGVPAKPIG